YTTLFRSGGKLARAEAEQRADTANGMLEGVEDAAQRFAHAAHADDGDERLEYFIGALADHVDPRVAHHAFVGLIGEVRLTAEDLDGVVDDGPEMVGGEDLEHGGFEHVIVGAAVDGGGALGRGRFHGKRVRRHDSELLFD